MDMIGFACVPRIKEEPIRPYTEHSWHGTSGDDPVDHPAMDVGEA